MNRWFGLRLPAGLGLAVSLLMAAPVGAQDAPAQVPQTVPQTVPRPAAVLGLMRPSDGADGELQEVLTSSIAVKLARRGLQAITDPAAALGASTAASSETLFTLASRVEADYVLEGVYSNSRDEIEIQLVWYNATTRQASVSVSERGKLGLNMDRLISEALTKIFSQVDEELAHFSRASVPGILGSPELAPASDLVDTPLAAPVSLQSLPAVAGGTGRLPGPSTGAPKQTDPGLRPDARLRPDLEPGEILEPESPPVAGGKPRRKYVELSTAGSAFIATGEASEYFKIGYGSSMHLDLLIPAGPGSFGVGLYAGFNYFEATGMATSAQSLLVPLGVDVRYTLVDVFPVGLFVHASGGPAILVLRSDYWGELTKLVPYALAGLGMNLRFAPFMGTALDLSYSVYFEGSLLIMAFSPSVSLYFRF